MSNWIDEERIFSKKCAMTYEAFIDKLFPGYIDHYSDLIVDWIETEWKESTLGWEKAARIVDRFLIPTLTKIKPIPAFIFAGAPTSQIQCPHCGKTMTIPKQFEEELK